MKIAITAASGQLGSEIVMATCLIVGQENVIGLARTPGKAAHLGVEVRKGDYNNREELEALVRSTGFYRNKAKNIQGACHKIVTEFEGEVPQKMERLLTLPGVARKTANVVLAHGYGILEGVTVDTHVKRLSNRLGLTKNDSPVKIEQDLMKLIPQPEWENYSIRIIFHGRAICKARKPNCADCQLAELCPSVIN